MRILVVDSYYRSFVAGFYARSKGIREKSYAEQWRALMDACFGTADFYSSNLSALGHPAAEVVSTCDELQLQWAREHDLPVNRVYLRSPAWSFIPPQLRFRDRELERILVAQVADFRPDVVHFQDPVGTSPNLLRKLRHETRLITAQVASHVPDFSALAGYDVILSSFPHFVKRFEQAGIRSAYFRLGFESSVLSRVVSGPSHDVVFVGGLTRRHPRRTLWLEQIAERVPVKWWGYGRENLARNSPLHSACQGPAWGLDMYNIFFNSRVVLNFNEPVQARDGTEDFANNMRLYEATGVGAMLLTDYKPNLDALFAVGSEVVAYRSAEECGELVDHFLSNEDERARIAAAGQARTLREHSYQVRMQEFLAIVEPLLDLRRQG